MLKRMPKLIIITLVAVFSFASLPENTVSVAANSFNGALAVPYHFRKVDGDIKPKAFQKTNMISVALGTGYSKKKVSISNLSAGVTIYVPKNMVSKNGSSFGVMFSAITDPQKYGDRKNAESLEGAYIAAINRENGKLIKGVYDVSDGSKTGDTRKHLLVKQGRGSQKNEYVMIIRNIPYSYCDGQPVTSEKSYFRGVVIGLYGQNKKASGKILVDNVNVKSGKKKLFDYTFNNDKGMPEDCTVICNKKPVKGVGIADVK